MMILEIERAGNKKHNNKKVSYNEKTGLAKLGRTEYKISFGCHQPNIPNGDYTVIDHTVKTADGFILYRLDSEHLNTGVRIYKFKIRQ